MYDFWELDLQLDPHLKRSENSFPLRFLWLVEHLANHEMLNITFNGKGTKL